MKKSNGNTPLENKWGSDRYWKAILVVNDCGGWKDKIIEKYGRGSDALILYNLVAGENSDKKFCSDICRTASQYIGEK